MPYGALKQHPVTFADIKTHVAETPMPYGALKLRHNFVLAAADFGGGNANALRGTETRSRHYRTKP